MTHSHTAAAIVLVTAAIYEVAQQVKNVGLAIRQKPTKGAAKSEYEFT